MTNDEIKKALKYKMQIRHCDRAHQTAIIYAYAKSWRVSVDDLGRFISSLELVTGGNCPSVTIANAEECELVEGESK